MYRKSNSNSERIGFSPVQSSEEGGCGVWVKGSWGFEGVAAVEFQRGGGGGGGGGGEKAREVE